MLNRKLLYILIVSVFTTANLFAQSQDPPSAEELKRQIIKREKNDVAEGKWFYKVSYPELQLQGGLLHEGFRIASKEIAEKQINDFRKTVDALTDEDWNSVPKGIDYEMSFGFEIELLNDDFISVNFGRYEYTGGVHGNSWTTTLNYDLKNNKVLDLKDLFNEGTNYQNIISKTSIEQISNKQGRYADVDWINRGASSDEKNFDSWNITVEGLKISFDPYEVGPYSAGSFQTVIPYSQFLDRMKTPLFRRVETASYIDGSPANWCRNGLFPSSDVEFKLAYVKADKTYFHGDEKSVCPAGVNCKKKSYVVKGDEVIIGRTYNNFACAWYQPDQGSETVGWLALNDISVQGRRSPIYDWIGEWSFYDNDIKFTPEKTIGDFLVTGTAFWRGLGDNIHTGDLEFSGTPRNGVLDSGKTESEYDCSVKMQRVGKYLVVADNKNCGGANVTFDGIYVQNNNSQSANVGDVCSVNDFSEMTYDGSVRDVNFRLGTIKTKKRGRAYFIDNGGQTLTSYLVQGDEVVVSKTNSKYGCAWYQPKKGKETVGWISLDNLAFKPSSSIRQNWVGSWEYGEGEIKVIPQKRLGAYKFMGKTFWVGNGEGNVNIGDIDFVATPKADRLTSNGTKDLPECQVKMTLLGNYLIVSDNNQCGGRNVTFSGVYRKK